MSTFQTEKGAQIGNPMTKFIKKDEKMADFCGYKMVLLWVQKCVLWVQKFWAVFGQNRAKTGQNAQKVKYI